MVWGEIKKVATTLFVSKNLSLPHIKKIPLKNMLPRC
jgi:hypothetical protein